MERKPGFFDYDGPFMRICQEFASFILTNILFILCCVPVITIGPALVALTHVSLQHWRKGLQHSVPRIFWQAFCQNLKQGSILTLLLIIVGGTSIMDSCGFLMQQIPAARYCGGIVLRKYAVEHGLGIFTAPIKYGMSFLVGGCM